MTNLWRRLGDTARHVPPPDEELKFLFLAIVLVAIGAAFLGSVW